MVSESNHTLLQERADEHLLLHFAPSGSFGSDGKELLILERGEGSHVIDARGRRYVDGLSSLFCCQLGYSYGAEMAEAASAQLTKLCFSTNWGMAHPASIELSHRLTGLAGDGLTHAFFTNGGSESVEAAWKIVRQYHLARGQGERRKVIARQIAYHGVTLGALSFTGVERFKVPFGPPAIETHHVSSTNEFRSDAKGEDLTRVLLAEIEDTIEREGPESIAMVIAEPIQNAGGCLAPPPGYWSGLRDICDRSGALLVADEVISGCGRLGEWLASHRYGADPDLVTLAKGITSAYAPMGAVLVSASVAAALSGVPLMHGVTFGGHPLAAAIALKNIEIFERDGVLRNVRELEPYLREQLEDKVLSLPIVGDVRGDGFFFAAELVSDGEEGRFESDLAVRLVRKVLPEKLLEVGLIARADDRGDPVLQIAPPLVANRAVLDEIVDKMRAALVLVSEEVGMDSRARNIVR